MLSFFYFIIYTYIACTKLAKLQLFQNLHVNYILLFSRINTISIHCSDQQILLSFRLNKNKNVLMHEEKLIF